MPLYFSYFKMSKERNFAVYNAAAVNTLRDTAQINLFVLNC
jgi:hypothetical protein